VGRGISSLPEEESENTLNLWGVFFCIIVWSMLGIISRGWS
jgi:hypothetical protein